MKKYKLKKIGADIILIAVLILSGAVFFAFLFFGSSQGRYAEIRVDGEVRERLSLDINTEKTIETAFGKNTVVIENGEVYMKEADCPDGVCKNMGRISKSGQSVICLPHKLVVMITDENESDKDENSIDIVVK